MLWAIDVGNTHLVVGVHDGTAWRATWRLASALESTEDDFAARLSSLAGLTGLTMCATGVIVASVVPSVDETLRRFGKRWLKSDVVFLRSGDQVGLEVTYDPPRAVGADRIANALGALKLVNPPVVVVDFGTATTFDAIDASGAYIGGAILPGVELAMLALAGRTAKLPKVELSAPAQAIGRTTAESLQSGLMLGYAGAIDALAEKFTQELGNDPVLIATGGLSGHFMSLCKMLHRHEPLLTLDGLRLAWDRLAHGEHRHLPGR